MNIDKLLLILTFMIISAGNLSAQNNDMKARMEYEDAEMAYQSKNWRKAIEHLENAEKLLGKPNAKTRYLLILSLRSALPEDYTYGDLEKLRNLTKHYLDNYTTDIEKYREIYDLSDNLDKHFPKSLAQYDRIKKENEEEQKRLAIEKREREKAAIVAADRNRNNFLNYKTVSFYNDGKDIQTYKICKDNLIGTSSYRDKKTKKRYYILTVGYDMNGKKYNNGHVQFRFNENKLSYEHIKTYYSGDITTSTLEKYKKDFLKDVNDFSKKYSLTPKMTKDNTNGEILTYTFSYENKTAEFRFQQSYVKGNLAYSEAITVTNHNYENK